MDSWREVITCCVFLIAMNGISIGMLQVSSWTFVPGATHSGKVCNAGDGSAGCDKNGRECNKNAKSGSERQCSDCGGCLEIHSVKLLDERSVPAAQVRLLLHS